jgi:hypothetical protein
LPRESREPERRGWELGAVRGLIGEEEDTKVDTSRRETGVEDITGVREGEHGGGVGGDTGRKRAGRSFPKRGGSRSGWRG